MPHDDTCLHCTRPVCPFDQPACPGKPVTNAVTLMSNPACTGLLFSYL